MNSIINCKSWTTLCLLLVTSASQSFAAGAYRPTATPLVTLQRGGGFAPVPRIFTVVIDSSGRITKSVGIRGGQATKTDIAQLSTSSLKRVQEEIASLHSSQLVRTDDGPQCADAPSTQIRVNKATRSNKELVISQTVNCQTSAVEGSEMLVNLIETMSDLSN